VRETQLTERDCEFPVVPDTHVGQTWQEFDCGVGYYCMEPVYVSEENYLLNLIFNSHQEQSELWIFPAAQFTDGPCCQLRLPAIVPFGFHGKWAQD